jgi:hypothetical protein
MKEAQLIQGYLDGTLAADEEAELGTWLRDDPQNAIAFADAARLHDRLHDVICAKAAADERLPDPLPERAARRHAPRRRWRIGVVGGLTGLAAAALLVVWLWTPRQIDAAMELSRLIDQSSAIGDRTYRIHNLDSNPETYDDKKPPIDGAELYVRTPDQYVLVRRFPDGRRLFTGSDGERSWVVPPDGAVHVSADPMRFRGPLPGNQHGIPFLDLRSDLVQLRESYTLTLLPQQSNGWRGLLAEKRSTAFRGPRRVEIRYDAQNGVIHQMIFAGLPRARGGPDSVSVALLNQQNLSADFFQHQAHHAPDRAVIEEE